MSLKLKKYVLISGIIHCRTGLRIGGSKDEIEIGGMDYPIIRHPVTKHPYIPGSSLKGKLRTLLEYKYDKVGSEGKPCGCGKPDCPVCPMFGPHFNPKHKLGPTRLICRDALLTEDSVALLEPMLEDGLQYAEVKSENIIDRRTGIAAKGGLRTQERVPAGTEFDFNLALRVFEGDNETDMLARVAEGLRLLEADYLGGSGTRGYGQVEFRDLKKDGQPWPNWRNGE